MTELRFSGVQVAYPTAGGRRVAVAGADLTVASGEFVALVGPSGCGKSTLLKTAARIVTPTAGTVTFDGVDVAAATTAVGMVFQHDALLPWRTVADNVALPLQIAGVPRASHDARITELLGRVGLGAFADYLPRQLAGGMRKRVALARTLAADPQVFLMDEPFGPLDALTRREVAADFLRLWEELRTTVVFVTHDVDEALLLADRAVVMSPGPGRIVAEFTVDLERPRSLRELRFTSEYHALYDGVNDALGAA